MAAGVGAEVVVSGAGGAVYDAGIGATGTNNSTLGLLGTFLGDKALNGQIFKFHFFRHNHSSQIVLGHERKFQIRRSLKQTVFSTFSGMCPFMLPLIL
jgi:hypothetical protein